MSILQTIVAPPGSFSAGATVSVPGTKQGSAAMDTVHGKWYAANYAGKVFWAATAAAGTTIPISSSTSPTFMLLNPVSSGVNLEVISAHVGITNATEVVSPIFWGVVTNLAVNPTSITKITTQMGILGQAPGNIGIAASAATLAAAATIFYPFTDIQATANGLVVANYEYDGKLVIPPGALIHLCGTAAQTSATYNAITWAEWPV
jgi:hypothetical protein